MRHLLHILLSITLLHSFSVDIIHAQERDTTQRLLSVWETDSMQKHISEHLPYKSLRPRIGVVLSGGGAKGMAHVGVLKVLEDLEIPIDYIGGTSMGAIIGGLYAYGYSAHELDSILRAADWSKLLNDAPDWQDMFYINKDNYLLHLPWGGKENPTLLPMGLLKGQHINNLFYTLTSQSYKYKNFREFNIPFFCVGANIVNGQPAYIDSGNLAVAMRASMAIPSVFTPVKIDSMMLVDGGVLNNFPVDKMLEKGVDIVIGVDVGFSYAGVENVSSFMDVLEEVIFMGSKVRVMQNRNNCNIFIKPDMKGFSTASFNKTDSILSRGEKAARDPLVYERLKKLSEDLKNHMPDPPKEKRPYLPEKEIFISQIEYNGLKKYNKAYINQFLQVSTGKWVKLEAITKGVDRLYGLGRFKTVSYEFKVNPQQPDETVLCINVEEAPSHSFKVGVRYDNNRMATLLAGVEFQNFGLKNSVFSVDVELSKMPVICADFRFMPQWKNKKSSHSIRFPMIGIGFDFHNFNSYLYRDPEHRKKRSSDMLSNRYRAKIYGQSAWRTNVLGVGLAYEFAANRIRLVQNSTVNRNDIFDNQHIYPYVYYKHNSFNQKFYPRRGTLLTFDASLPVKLGNPNAGNGGSAPLLLSLYGKGDFALSAGKRLTFYPGFTIGLTPFHGNSVVPIQYQFFQGGYADLTAMNITMMPGVLLGQSSGYQLINIRLTAQIMVFKNLYLSLRGAIGKADYDLSDFVKNYDNLVYGGNIGLSYDTPIGPVGLSFQSSNLHSFNVFLHIGYWF